MSIVGFWASRRKGPTKNLGNSPRIRYARGRKRNHGTILLIPTFLREEVTETVRATIIFTVVVGRKGKAVRKIVTAKDFEFSPRKESAAAEPAGALLPSHVHALCMHNGAARKMSWQPQSVEWLPCLYVCGVISPMYGAIPYAGVRISIPRDSDACNFAGGPLIALIRFSNSNFTRGRGARLYHVRCKRCLTM